MRWTRGRYEIEMTNEPLYSFGSVDNARSFSHEFLFEQEYRPSSKHGLECFLDGEPRSSVVLGASGGGTGVHEHSCLLLSDRCLVAVGDRVAALALPDLSLLWQVKADDATCFGLHVTPDDQHVVVHGEFAISRFTMDGQKEWEFFGKDIFTGTCAIREGTVVVSDFNDEEYLIDLELGRGRIIKATIKKETNMTSASSAPHNRRITLILLAMCGLLAIAAVVVGIDDNPPGILLAFLAATAFVLAFVHPWRTARKFMLFLLASVLGFVLFVILNITLDTVAQDPANTGTLQDLLESPAIEALSIIIALICPAALIVGAVGSVAMFIRGRRRPT